jgi:hypothetical protein
LWKSVKIFQIWLKFGKGNGHFTWWPEYILLLLAALHHHTSAFFKWNCIRLSWWHINITWMCHNATLYVHCQSCFFFLLI